MFADVIDDCDPPGVVHSLGRCLEQGLKPKFVFPFSARVTSRCEIASLPCGRGSNRQALLFLREFQIPVSAFIKLRLKSLGSRLRRHPTLQPH